MVTKKEKTRRERISKNNARYWLGKHRSKEDKEKMRLAKLGKYIKEDNPFYGKTHTTEVREKLRKANTGKRAVHPFPKGHIPWNKGIKSPYSGQNHYNWQGGKTDENKRIRNSFEMRVWRKAVFERDGFTCQICRAYGCKLNADHIKPFAYYPDLRFVISNGRTLCVPCHKKTSTFSGRAKRLSTQQNKDT